MKESKNPWVIQKTTECFDRECALSNIPYVIRPDGTRGCIWCGDDLKTQHHSQRYCKDKECPKSAYIWGYPQRDESLVELLKNQNYTCNICDYDYSPKILEIMENKIQSIKNINFTIYELSALKKILDKQLRLEVDHIIPIMSGGESLGINNHQAICYSCHKLKTKIDIKGIKRIKSKEELDNIAYKKKKEALEKKSIDFYLKSTHLHPYIPNQSNEKNQENWIKYRQDVKNIFLDKECSNEELELIINEDDHNIQVLKENSQWAKEILEKRKKMLN